MPHGQPSHKAIAEGDFVTIDYGAMVNGCNSDMTRTFGVGHASEKMKEVYQIVLEPPLKMNLLARVGSRRDGYWETEHPSSR